VSAARTLAGRPHRIQGRVEKGAERGRTIGFPTANLTNVEVLLPADGVYVVRAFLPDGSRRFGACNVGPNPTFATEQRKVEIHLLDFAGDLYGRIIEADFLARLRSTRKFAGVDELVAQIERDVGEARVLAAQEPPERPQSDLARTIEEWVRVEVEPALSSDGASLIRAQFLQPGEIQLLWDLPTRFSWMGNKEIVFSLERRLRRDFPEVQIVESTTEAD
jgi:hypothetical protein